MNDELAALRARVERLEERLIAACDGDALAVIGLYEMERHMAGCRLIVKSEARLEGEAGEKMWEGEISHQWDNLSRTDAVAGQEVLKAAFHRLDDSLLELGKAKAAEKGKDK